MVTFFMVLEMLGSNGLKVVVKRLASLGCKVSLRGMSPAVRCICFSDEVTEV